MKIVEIRINRKTLPKDGSKVKWQTYDDINSHKWSKGEFVSGDDLFVKNSGKWNSSWDVFHWKYQK